MAITSRMEIHPGTSLVPEMDRDDLGRLEEDILANGQRMPILTWRGLVVDGRARLKVLRKLRMQPLIEKIDPADDPIDVIISANVIRRQLEKSQVAMILARNASRRPEDLKAAGVSARTVQSAVKVNRIAAPEVVKAVDSGRLSVHMASKLADLPQEEQVEAVQELDNGNKAAVAAKVNGQKTTINRIAPVPEPAPAKATPTPESIVEQFRQTTDRLETIKQLFGELADHEKTIVAGFLGLPPAPQPKAEKQPEPAPEVTAEVTPEVAPEAVEVVRDRLSDELIESPRMVGLASRLGSQATAIGAIRLLFGKTEKHTPRGNVGKLSDAAIAKGCDWAGRSDVFISALVNEGWLQRDIEHRLLVVDWETHCQTETKDQVLSLGGFAEPTGIPVVKEAALKRKPSNKPVTAYSESFERFWESCSTVRRTKKGDAWKAWQKAIQIAKPPEGKSVEEWLIERMATYANSDKGRGKYCQQPSSWLNAGCYDDADEAWGEFVDQPKPAAKLEVTRPMTPLPGFDAKAYMEDKRRARERLGLRKQEVDS